MEGSTVSRPLPVVDPTDASASATGVEVIAGSNTSSGIVGASDSAVEAAPHDLKRKTARGALVSTFGQGSNFVLRIGSMVVLARLLNPADFGLVGMVTACTGF